jgi:hypothetical protein
MEKRDSHDPQEGTKTGSRQFVYKACMADHGQGPLRGVSVIGSLQFAKLCSIYVTPCDVGL